METMGQTLKRSESGESEDVIKERKKRRSGGDTLQWLEKKADRDLKFKGLQLEEQREEREFQQKERKKTNGASTETNSNSSSNISNSK